MWHETSGTTAVFHVTNGRTDGQTDRQTNRWTSPSHKAPAFAAGAW